MATTANILTLLKYYTSKQKAPMVQFEEFADYVHRYAQHHMNENSDLVIYCGASYVESLMEELQRLETEKQIAIGIIQNKDFIFVLPYIVERLAGIYKNIESNITIPFPTIPDLPKNMPHTIITQQNAFDFIYSLLESQELSDKYLYSLVFEKGVPSLLFPSNIPVTSLIYSALHKLQNLLRKEESHDYFLKKLTVSNPGKELSIKSFFAQFVAKPEQALDVIRDTGDTYYYWSQLFYFIKQDYTKLKDFTPEDVNILQAVAITEIITSYYKSRASEEQVRVNAFKTLENLLRNPPYYYSKSDITRMKDSSGVLLLGQYSEDELRARLNYLTTQSERNELPELLVFKVDENDSYFIYKEKVMPLIIRLTNDARTLIRESLIKHWYKHLLNYETLSEMKETREFERCLERELRNCSPILYAILNASFLSVIDYDDQTPGHLRIYRDGVMIPYSELLMLSRTELLSDAKIKLPFWYGIPIFSWLLGLLFRKPKSKKKRSNEASATKNLINEQRSKEDERIRGIEASEKTDPKLSRKRELRRAAAEAEKLIVPETSSLDRELEGYENEWNDRIGKKNHDNLTEDMNSLIRDYLRKTLRSLKTEAFTLERINSLAEVLVDSPSMIKIKNHPALKRYVALYLIKLVKNLP